MIDPILQIRDLSVFSGSKEILRHIHFDIPRHQVTVLLGPSGCGKTTLFKCLNRLTDLYPELRVSGQVLFQGRDIYASGQDITGIRQKMGLLNQKPYPLPMSIFSNVAYGLRLQGIRKRAILSDKVELHLREAALWDEVKDRLNDPAGRLSIGQQQRLCLARGLATNPEIILADEPTSALDPISSRVIEERFMALKKDYTVVVVTHILRQARRLADNVVFMYEGELIEQGPSDQLFNDPQSDLLKRYMKVGY